MPPKRKRSSNLDDPGKEGLYPDVSVPEDERTAPKKRGRKSIIDAILQAEGKLRPVANSYLIFDHASYPALKRGERLHLSSPRTSGLRLSFIHRT